VCGVCVAVYVRSGLVVESIVVADRSKNTIRSSRHVLLFATFDFSGLKRLNTKNRIETHNQQSTIEA